MKNASFFFFLSQLSTHNPALDVAAPLESIPEPSPEPVISGKS